MRRGYHFWLGLLLGLALVFLLPGIMRASPGRLMFLTYPSAWLAGCLLGVPVDWSDAVGPVLLYPERALRVVAGCAGADFLGLSSGLLLWVSIRLRPVRASLVLPAAWLLTVLANGVRLAGLVLAEAVMVERVPVYLHNALHAVVGIAVFLPALVMAYAFWERKVCRE